VGRELRIEASSGTKVFKDVLVGDVWIASGQSNMAQPSAMRSTGGESFEDWEGNPLLRSFPVAYNSWAAEPQTRQFPWETRVTNWFRWNISRGHTSAVPFFFGKKLQEETGLPIGLILVPLGASGAEARGPAHAMDVNNASDQSAGLMGQHRRCGSPSLRPTRTSRS
jgi:sialate O-acetylesterase